MYRILVTGATGFIGGRVCERLIQDGATQVRALVRNFGRAARISRLPIELRRGDLLHRESLREAIGDSSIIVHLGLGYGTAIPRGTRNLLEAAKRARVERFIHISSTAVYGLKPPPGTETEQARPSPTGDVYCDNKLKAEKAVQAFSRRGVATVILRPCIVTGPYSRWSTKLIDQLRRGKAILIDGGQGICNTTYVDNLVDAIFLSMTNEQALGQVFNITDGERVTWGEFVQAHAELINPKPAIRQLSSADFLEYHDRQPGFWTASFRETRRMLISPEFRQLVKQIPAGNRLMTWLWSTMQQLDDEGRDRFRSRLAGDGIGAAAIKIPPVVPEPETFSIHTAMMQFSIEKARMVLRYQPRISFAGGMERTAQWLRFANFA